MNTALCPQKRYHYHYSLFLSDATVDSIVLISMTNLFIFVQSGLAVIQLPTKMM